MKKKRIRLNRQYAPISVYKQHRHNAALRNVQFLLTFEEWYDIWLSSGHWDQRGRKADQYCMARFGDEGAYEVGNVKIITFRENSIEHKFSPEQIARRSDAIRKTWASLELRARQSNLVREIRRRST